MNPSIIDKQFNYKFCREMFNRYLSDTLGNYFQKVHDDVSLLKYAYPWSKDEIHELTKELLAAALIDSQQRSAYQQELLKNYCLFMRNETEIFFKGNNGRIALPTFDAYFKLLAELHLENIHASEQTLYDLLKKSLSLECGPVHYEIVRLFIKSCNICNEITQDHDNIIEEDVPFIIIDEKNSTSNTSVLQFPVVQICFVTMPKTDQDFKYILTYQDTDTGYILCRPLISLFEMECAWELMKIFTDFGPPHVIETTHVTFVMSLIRMIARCFPITAIAVRKKENCIQESKIKQLISDWMQKNCNSSWSTGCSILQWEINNKERSDNSTPFAQVFGAERVSDPAINSSQISEHIDLEPDDNNLLVAQTKAPIPAYCNVCKSKTYNPSKCRECKHMCHIYCCITFAGKELNFIGQYFICYLCNK